MYDLPRNTIAAYAANPLFDKFDMSSLPLSALSNEIKAFSRRSDARSSPERDALDFYFLNHSFGVLRSKMNPLEQLDDDLATVAKSHLLTTNDIAKRLLFYSAIICVEEARFLPGQDHRFWSGLENRFGGDFCAWAKKGFPGKYEDFGKLDMTCGEFAAAMVCVFAFGKWQPGYGGRGWVPIASLVSDCIHGRLSMEAMADQAFSLTHNGGCMFNKGHLYDHSYGNELYSILDVQDSGQIPQLIDSKKISHASPVLLDLHKIMARRFPDEMTGPVNEALVKNSEKKREQKAAALAKQQAAAWNQSSFQDEDDNKPKHDHRNDVLLGSLMPKRPGF